MNLNDLASFTRVAELGTITAAAAEEGVPKSTISRRIARLEASLGVELLRRSARRIALTDDARRLHARARGALEELTHVATDLAASRETPRGQLVITAPYDFGRSQILVDLLATYRRRFPDVRIDVRLETRILDLVREGVDVALRAHHDAIPGDPTLMSASLGRPQGALFASSEYLDARGTPAHPDELANHDLVVHRPSMAKGLRLVSPTGQEALVAPRAPAFIVNDFSLAGTLMGAGMGIGVAVALDPDVSGLRRVLPDWSVQGGRISLVWPASRHLAPRVRAFIDLASEILGDARWGRLG